MRELAYAGALPACPGSRPVACRAGSTRRAGGEHGAVRAARGQPGSHAHPQPRACRPAGLVHRPAGRSVDSHDDGPGGGRADRAVRRLPGDAAVRGAAAAAPRGGGGRGAERAVRAGAAAAVVGRLQLHLLRAHRSAARARPLPRDAGRAARGPRYSTSSAGATSRRSTHAVHAGQLPAGLAVGPGCPVVVQGDRGAVEPRARRSRLAAGRRPRPSGRRCRGGRRTQPDPRHLGGRRGAQRPAHAGGDAGGHAPAGACATGRGRRDARCGGGDQGHRGAGAAVHRA